MSRRTRGFSLIEILLVLAILAIVAGIAVPSLLGSRRHARYTGDAMANSAVIRMNLEVARADLGLYPVAGTYTWVQGAPPSGNPLPNVNFVNGTKLDFSVTINADRLSYTLTATDPKQSNKEIYKVDQTGKLLPLA